MSTPRRRSARLGFAFAIGGAAIVVASGPPLPTISGAIILAFGAYVLGMAEQMPH